MVGGNKIVGGGQMERLLLSNQPGGAYCISDSAVWLFVSPDRS